MSDGFTVIDNPQAILALRIRMIVRALTIKRDTGMNLTRNVPTIKALREQYGISARTVDQAIDQLTELAEAQDREIGAA